MMLRTAMRVGRRLAVMAALATISLVAATALPTSAATTVSGPTPVTTNGSADNPIVATDGTDFLVVWVQSVSTTTEVMAAQVQGDGSTVRPLGALSDTSDGLNDSLPSVAWNGSKFLVTWQHEFEPGDLDVEARLVTRAGFLSGGVKSISNLSSNQFAPSVTARGATFLAVWTDTRNGSSDIFRGRVDNDGTVLDGQGVGVTSGSSVDYAPDVASNGSGFLVTYQRQSSGVTDLYGQRLNGSGGTVGSVFPVAATIDVEEAPQVASDGTDYLVVWNHFNAGNIAGAVVSSTGSVSAPIPISVAPSTQDVPEVAFNGTYLVAWRDARGGSNAAYAARVDSDGTVEDPSGFLVDSGPGLVGGPGVSAAPGKNTWAVAVDHNPGGGIIHRTVTASK